MTDVDFLSVWFLISILFIILFRIFCNRVLLYLGGSSFPKYSKFSNLIVIILLLLIILLIVIGDEFSFIKNKNLCFIAKDTAYPNGNLKLIILCDSFFKLSNILEVPKVFKHKAKLAEFSSSPQ